MSETPTVADRVDLDQTRPAVGSDGARIVKPVRHPGAPMSETMTELKRGGADPMTDTAAPATFRTAWEIEQERLAGKRHATDTAALREAAEKVAKWHGEAADECDRQAKELMGVADLIRLDNAAVRHRGCAATILSLLDELDRLRASPAPDRVSVKPLEWRTPTDHPKDPDADDNDFCADGIGGVYAISKPQKVGPKILLWWAHDPMVWTGFDTIADAKAAAQADYEKRILSALSEASK